MNFPMICVSEDVWEHNGFLIDYMLFEPWIYNDNDSSFYRYFKDKVFCDCDGKLFQVTEKHGTDSWRRWLRFLPNFYRVELKIESLDNRMELSELKEFLLDKFDDYELIEWVKSATSFDELMTGKQR